MYLFIYIFRRFLIKKKTILAALVGNEMIIANLALCASLAIYHLTSNANS